MVLDHGKGTTTTMRTTYFYEVKCNACRTTLQRGNRLEATVQMINHAEQKHNKEDWKNLLDTAIIQMIWHSPKIEGGKSNLTNDEIIEFMGIMAKDQDIPYDYYVRFTKNLERNGV